MNYKQERILLMQAGREMDLFVDAFVMLNGLKNAYKMKVLDGINEAREDCPHYSTNMSDVWEVVIKMLSMGYYFELHHDLNAWTAKFCNADTNKCFTVNTTKTNAAGEICRAALCVLYE